MRDLLRFSTRSHRQITTRTGSVFFAIFLSLMGLSSLSQAQWVYWDNPGTGNWNAGVNWAGGTPPGTSNYAMIDNGGTAQITDAQAIFYLENRSGSLEILSGGDLEITDKIFISAAVGTATLRVDGGIVNSTNRIVLGVNLGGMAGIGTAILTNGGQIQTSDRIFLGESGGTGTLQIGDGGAAGTVSALSIRKGINGGPTGTLRFNHNETNYSFGTQIGESGAGSDIKVIQTGTGTTVLTNGSNRYTGGTDLLGGTLSVSENSNLGDAAGGLTFDGGTLRSTGSFTMNRATTLTSGGGTFEVASGQTVTHAGAITGGGGLTKSGDGQLTLIGANIYSGGTTLSGGTLSVSGNARLGDGLGTLTFDGGTLQITGTFFMNRATTLNSGGGTFEVTSGQTVTQVGAITGGGVLTKSGEGQLTLTAANTYSGNTRIAAGTLAFESGGSLTATSSEVLVGTASGQTGTLSIGAGSSADVFRVGIGSGGTGIVNVSGANASLIGWSVRVGDTSSGTLNVTAGGQVNTSGEGLRVGASPGGFGVVTINGVGSRITASSAIIGYAGSGTLNLEEGGVLDLEGTVLTLSEAGSNTLNIGTGGAAGALEDTLAILGSHGTSVVNFNHTGNLVFATPMQPISTGNFSVNKLGTGTTTLTAANYYNGGTTFTGGILSVSSDVNLGGGALTFDGGTLQITGSFTMNRSTTVNAGNGTIEIASGQSVNQQGAISGIGSLSKTGDGMLTLSGDNTGLAGGVTLNAGILTVTTNTALGTGTLTINGGTFNRDASSSFTFTNNLIIAGDFTNRGNGIATSTNFSGTVSLGNASPKITLPTYGDLRFSGEVSGTGGFWLTGSSGVAALTFSGANTYTGLTKIENGRLTLRSSGLAINDDLTIDSGGVVEVFADENIINTADVVVNGRLEILDSIETINSLTGSGNIELRPDANIGMDNAATLAVGSGNFSGNISKPVSNGTGNLRKLSTGTLTLSGSNDYRGATTVEAGTLLINGANTGAGTATVKSGATLGGSGSIAATVIVESGGILSPGNSPGTFTIGELVLDAGSRTRFELGSPSGTPGVDSDLIDVVADLSGSGSTGNLTIADGSLFDLTALTGFADGTYRLFDYDGTPTLNANQIFFATAPAGYNLELTNDTAAKQINLTVNYDGLQFWNGSTTTPDGTVHGGSGTWDTATRNWTNETGNTASTWSDLTAVFAGTSGGTATLNDDVTVGGLQFGTDGYTLTGTGSIELGEAETEVRIDAGIGAVIDVELTGSNTLVKTGDGTISLTAANTHSGGTEVLAGTLLVGDDDALGTGPLTLEADTTFGTTANTSVFLNSDVTVNGDISLQVDSASFLEIEGTVDLGSATRTLTLTETGSMVCFMGDLTGSNGLTLLATSAGEFMFCGTDSNTYTGLTTVGNGVTLVLNKDAGITAIEGNLEIQTGGKVVLLDSSDQINSAATVTVNGTLEIDGVTAISQTLGNLQGSGTITNVLDDAELEIRSGNFNGTITESLGADELSIRKSGTGLLTLSQASTYSGGTVITGGTLRTTNADALGSGAVTLSTGGTLNPVGTLTIASLTWNGGTLATALGTAVNLLEITGNLTLTGIGIFDFTQATGFKANTEYLILTAANLDTFTAAQFGGNLLAGVKASFRVDAATDSLYVSFRGSAQGLVIQNNGPYFTPETADFLVTGAARTGGPTDNNTVNSLAFVPGSSLQVSNILTVTSGNITVNVGSATLTGGSLFTPGAFTKLGSGVLNLLSNVWVNGPATVRAGSLLINGPFATLGGLTVSPGALLGGSGFIFGNVINNGTLAPGNSPGTLSIAGNLTLGNSGTTQIEVASLSVFDQILVSGLATLGGTLEVLSFDGFEFEYGQQFNFLSAGDVTGQFASVEMPEGFRGRILTNGGAVTLVAAPLSYTLMAQNQNQFNVAAALDGFIPATRGDRLTVSVALDQLAAEQYPAAFDQISPAFYQSLTSTTIEQYNSQGQFLQQRFSSVALGRQAGFAQYGTQAPVLSEKAGKAVTDAKDIVEATPDNHWGIWTLGNGIFANSSLASVSNYRSQSGGFLVGGDYRLGDSLVAGVFGGYQGTVSRYDNGGRTTINAARFGAYASYNPGSGFYANTVVGGGYSAYDVKRPIQFGSVNRAANSAPGGAEFVSQLTTGYDWKAGGFTFGPVGGLQYTYAGIGGFGETGADSLNLKMGQQNANSLRTTLGARAAYTILVTDKIAIIPEVRMSWQHEFLMNPTSMSAALDGGAGPGFGYTTSAPARDAVFAGAGVTLQVGDRWNANVYYNADFGRSDYNAQMVSGGLGVSF